MNLVRSCALELRPKERVSAVAFHPTKPVIAIGVGNHVYLHDLHRGSLLATVKTEKPVSALQVSDNSLLARTGGDFYVWEYSSLELLGVLYLSDEKTIQETVLSNFHPFVSSSRIGSKAVFVHDVSRKEFRKPSLRLDCKRPASGLAMHPKEPLLAVYSEGTIRIWDLQSGNQVTQCDELLKQKEYMGPKNSTTSRGFLSFSSDGSILAVANEKKQIYTFEFEDRQLSLLASNGSVPSTGSSVIAVKHHPKLNVFWVLQSNGYLEAFCSIKCKKRGVIHDESIAELDAVEQFSQLADFQARDWVLAKDSPNYMAVHPLYNYIAFSFKRNEPRKNFLVYSLYNQKHRFSRLPSVCGAKTLPSSYLEESNCYAENFYYVSADGQVMNYDIRSVASNVLKDISFMLESTGFWPYEIRYCQEKEKFIMFFETFSASEPGKPQKNGEFTFSVFSSAQNSPVKLTPGRDAFFPIYSNDKDISLISLSATTNELSLGGSKVELERFVRRIFTSPLAEGMAIIFVLSDYIVCSANADPQYKGKTPYSFDYSRKIKLRRWETVHQVLWNRHSTMETCENAERGSEHDLVAILTSHRILIATAHLDVLTFVEAPHQFSTVYFNSIYWVGMSLFYIAESHVHYLTLDGKHQLLCELGSSEATFVSIWNDRIMTCAWNATELKVMANGVGLLEPLLLGELAATGICGRPKQISKDLLQHIIRTYDYKRTDLKLIKQLQHHGYYDVALQLSIPHSVCTYRVKFDAALKSRKLYTAMEMLEEQCRVQKAAPPLHGEARRMAEELAKVCTQYGQYFLSYRCYELLQDYYTLLQNVVIHRDMHGLTFLKKRVQAKPEYRHLLSACKKLMKNKQLMSGDATMSRDFVFTNLSMSLDPTPIVVPDMQGNPKMSNPHIFPWAFLDTQEKWFPGRLNDAQNLGPSFSEPPQDAHAVDFPSSIQEVVSLFVLRMKGITNEVAAAEKTVQHPPATLEPPPLARIALSRDTYSISCSSALEKNQSKSVPDQETSVVSMSESLVSGDSSDEEDTIEPDGDSETKQEPAEEFPEDESQAGAPETPEEANDTKNPSGEEDSSPTEPEVTETKEEAKPQATKPCSPVTIVSIAKEDIEKYPCTTFARWGYIGNLKRRETLGQLANIKVPVHEFFSAFDSITSAQRMLDIGMFSSAMCHIEKAIYLLVSGKTAAEYKRKEVKICVYYKLALRLLTAIKLLDHSGDIQEVAYLSRVLASIPLRPVHRISAMAVAADKNLIAENYGAASKFLLALKNKGLYEGSNIEEVLAQCEEKGFSNAVGYISPQRPMCCYSTFKEIAPEADYLFCSFCDAVFRLEVKQPAENCCFCKHGTLQESSLVD